MSIHDATRHASFVDEANAQTERAKGDTEASDLVAGRLSRLLLDVVRTLDSQTSAGADDQKPGRARVKQRWKGTERVIHCGMMCRHHKKRVALGVRASARGNSAE